MSQNTKEIYQLWESGAKLTRHALKSLHKEEPIVQKPIKAPKVKVKQKIQNKQEALLEQIYCQWCNVSIVAGLLCSECQQQQLNKEFCVICSKGWKRNDGKQLQCNQPDCAIWIHKGCDTAIANNKTLLKDISSNGNVKYRCSKCRNKQKQQILNDILRFLSYFDADKLLWQLDRNSSKYFEVIKFPIDFVTIYEKNANDEYLSQADPYTAFVNDVKLLISNCLEFNLRNTKAHHNGLVLKVMFEYILKQIKPIIKMSDEDLIRRDPNQLVIQPNQLVSQLSIQFLNLSFGGKDSIQLVGESNYIPKWEPQRYSLSSAITQALDTTNPLLKWELGINNQFTYENPLEPLIKLNIVEFTRHQVQQDVAIIMDPSVFDNQILHPFLDYLLDKQPPAPSDESSVKLEIQQLMTKLITKDLSRIELHPQIMMKVSNTYIFEYVCCTCGGYEHRENLLFCIDCKNTYHFYCQIRNANVLPSRVAVAMQQSTWKCNNCVQCKDCGKQGSKYDLFCSLCNDFYHTKCALPNFITQQDVLDFWKCPKCFKCQQCDSTTMMDMTQISKMKPSTTSGTLHISVEYLQNFTCCLSCGLQKSALRFCEHCEQYIRMNVDLELVKPFLPEISQIEGDLYKAYFEEVNQVTQFSRVYLNKDCKEVQAHQQCLKCQSFFHLACQQKYYSQFTTYTNGEPSQLTSAICSDCSQDMPQILHKFEKLKQQSILLQVQAKSIKKVLPFVSTVLKFDTSLQNQTFVLENIEKLEACVNQFNNSRAAMESIKAELSDRQQVKDEYIDKLSQYWAANLNFLEQPEICSQTLFNRQLQINANIEEDFYERILTFNYFRNRKKYLILACNTMLGVQDATIEFDAFAQLAQDTIIMSSELQCLYVDNLQQRPNYYYIEDLYYMQYISCLENMQQDSIFRDKWNLSPQQQILFLPIPISSGRSIKKHIGIQILDHKHQSYKESILVHKGWIRIHFQELKKNLARLSEKYTNRQISEKMRQYYNYRRIMDSNIKEIRELYEERMPEIHQREFKSDQQLELEPIETLQQPKFQQAEDTLMSSPLDRESCVFCQKKGNRRVSGRLLYVDGTRWVHVSCVLWNEDCREADLCVKQLLNNHTIKCDVCIANGASVVCYQCRRRCHFYCGYANDWHYYQSKKVLCKECGKNNSNEIEVTNLFNWRKFIVQQKQDKKSKSLQRFGNTILIQITQSEQRPLYEELKLVLLREYPLYLSLNMKTSKLRIHEIKKEQITGIIEQNSRIFQQAAQLAFDKLITPEHNVMNLDNLFEYLQLYGIPPMDEDCLGQLLLLYTQHVRQVLLDKNQPKSVNLQMTAFKQWFYQDYFVEDLPLDIRTAQIQYLSRVITDTNPISYSNHPMLYDAHSFDTIKLNTKLSRKESHYPQSTLQPYDLLFEAELLSDDVKQNYQVNDLEKRLLMEYCKNKRPRLYVAPSKIHKYGLFTKQAIKQGELVIEYTGEIIRNALADYREVRYNEEGFGDCYMFRASKNTVIDATFKGSEARFFNHSCQPNCASLPTENKILIYAKQNIAQCEELTYDYQFEVEAQKITCFCGAKNCLGILN